MPKKETASTVKPHTEAKLQFYARYLERYLKILLRTPAVDKINIYDMFCGEGVYSDGNTGSALRAVEAIWSAQIDNTKNKPINLHLNDLKDTKIEKLKAILNNRGSQEKAFNISYSVSEASDLLDRLTTGFLSQDPKTRNLIFIDPYGYKEITKDALEKSLSNGKSEIILFLPIEQMYRFLKKTLDDQVENSYKPLKILVDQFGLDASQINSEIDFIRLFAKAISFNSSFYSTYYAIKNHTGHYYGMFFVTSNIYGLEKIVEVKWELDSQQGEGFTGEMQSDFFLEAEKQSILHDKLEQYVVASDRDNIELYQFVLNLGFLPKHANDIFYEWQNKSQLEVFDLEKNKPARKKSFKINYKDISKRTPIRRFSLDKGD